MRKQEKSVWVGRKIDEATFIRRSMLYWTEISGFFFKQNQSVMNNKACGINLKKVLSFKKKNTVESTKAT